MNQIYQGPRYLLRWDHSCDQRFGRDRLTTTHRLAEMPLFSNESLAEILDRYPRESLCVSTMGCNPAYISQSRAGRLGNHSGTELIEILRRGRLRLRMQCVTEHHRQLGRIVRRLLGEMMECQPGLRIVASDAELEISSPFAQTEYGHDTRPNIFWQIRGSRTVWSYPAREPFVMSERIEQSIVRSERSSHYFEPAFDDQAQTYQLTSGDLLALPQYTPYRVANDSDLNITLTTSCETRQSHRRNQIHLANHLLRRFVPELGFETTGPAAIAKRALLFVSGTPKRTVRPPEPTFCVDAAAPLGVGPLEALPERSVSSNPIIAGLTIAASCPAAAMSEN